jgi:hypothetical protein
MESNSVARHDQREQHGGRGATSAIEHESVTTQASTLSPRQPRPPRPSLLTSLTACHPTRALGMAHRDATPPTQLTARPHAYGRETLW